jgi:C1A family cysteine protease
MKVNHFADLTKQEFTDRYLSKGVKVNNKPTKATSSHPLLESKHLVLPESVDWKAKAKVSLPGDQGDCGSCWAWTTAALMESLNAIENDLAVAPVYSVQYLLDCDTVNWGCDGGWMLDAFDFTKEKGVIKWEDYPKSYMGRATSCSED